MSLLLGEEVVGNANAAHGGQMTADNGSGNVAGDVGGFSLACLDFPKGSAPELAVLGNSVIERGDLGVEIPAVVVELARKGPDFLQVLFFQIHEADHHVGDLDAGIVDIILDFHPLADRPQQASKGVAQNGVAQVSDVGGLVGVDIGVLENDLSRAGKGGSFPGWLQQSPENVIPLQEAIEVSGACHLHFGHTRNIGQVLHDFGSDLTRRPFELLGQLEAKGKGQIAQFDPGWLFRDHLGQGIPVAVLNVLDQAGLDAVNQRFQHAILGLGRTSSKGCILTQFPGKPGDAPHFSSSV